MLSLFASKVSGVVEQASPLVDVILPRDQMRLEQVILGGEPYDSLETAYLVSMGASALGNTANTKKVMWTAGFKNLSDHLD